MSPRFVILWLHLLSTFCSHAISSNDSIDLKLSAYINNIQTFNRLFPQEKVYLHFDNTSYFKGDTIWYKCYVTNATDFRYTQVSKVLYVELLTPEGQVVDTRKLKIVDGQCHGDLSINKDLHSGYYEVRAYTRYMLNWDSDWIFSRVFPVFEKPVREGDYSKRVITGYQHRQKLIPERDAPLKLEKLNVTFYPEGGQLIKNIPSRIAFKATDENGQDVKVTGKIQGPNGKVLDVVTTHQGMGSFEYCPTMDNERIVFSYKKRKYAFVIPNGFPKGYVMQVDNMRMDSLSVQLRKSSDFKPETLGLSILCRGKVVDFRTVTLEDDSLFLQISKDSLPPGVNQLTLFNSAGRILSERLFFVDMRQQAKILNLSKRQSYKPNDRIQLDFEAAPNSTFSLSVRDKATDIGSQHGDILTDMLLSSDLKGYIQTPEYYFKESDDTRRTLALDLLLLVQGWRRYHWKQMAIDDAFQITQHPEDGIILEGVLRPVPIEKELSKKKKNKTERNDGMASSQAACLDSVRLFLEDLDRFGKGQPYSLPLKLDSTGRFRLRWDDFENNLPIRLVAEDKGRADTTRYADKFQLVLDRVFSPTPRGYSAYETGEDLFPAMETKDVKDSILEAKSERKRGITEVQVLSEVSVSGKSKQRTFLTYDVEKDRTRWRDQGIPGPKDFVEYLNMKGYPIKKTYGNNNTIERLGLELERHLSHYRDQINDGRPWLWNWESYMYFANDVYVDLGFFNTGKWGNSDNRIWHDGHSRDRISFKRISKILLYDDVKSRSHRDDKAKRTYFCIIVDLMFVPYEQSDFVDGLEPHIRTTKLEGFSAVKSFYAGTNPPIPGDVDYRRTIYWNPDVKTGDDGKASVSFYNNSICRKLSVNAEGLTKEGLPLLMAK